MSAIARTLWFIESHYREDVCLDDLAAITGVSRFYLSRIFSMATGYTVSGYVRGRRLTEAARALAAGAPDILQVALEAGYSSHEAFTRAFRGQFGMTPEDVRRRRTVESLNLVEAMRMEAATKITLDPPRVERIGPMRLAGLRKRFAMGSSAEIPALWQQFGPMIPTLTGLAGSGTFGVVGEMPEGCEEFDYMAAVQVTETADIPPDLATLRLPARTWARFAHKGHVTTIRETCAAIGDYLPARQLEQGDSYSFLEWYGPDFDARTGNGTIEIWIGLKDQALVEPASTR